MNEEQPTPPPYAYQEPPSPQPQKPEESELQFAADKIGFIPNFRKSDNIFQLQFIGITTLLCIVLAMIAPFGNPEPPLFAKALIGLFAGLVLGLILSGLVLAIKNLKR